jgi:IclR family transcriptional regulator, acetate operon repressor
VTVTAVSRCLTLLELLACESEPIELAELVQRLDLPASAVHRLITTLVNHGWVTQDAVRQKYALSLRMNTLAFRHLDACYVPDIIQSVLDKLAQETREYCRIAILENKKLVWAARAQGATTGLRYDPDDMGQDIALHATAHGKAWLASLPEEEAFKIAYSSGFGSESKLGPNAVRTIDELRATLNETRQRGFATSINEAEDGTAAIAIPFHDGPDSDAPIAGTISVAGLLARIKEDRWPEILDALHSAAKEISEIWPMRKRQRR